MYVFGGFDGEQRVNSFHAYNFAEKRWSPVRVVKKKIYIYIYITRWMVGFGFWFSSCFQKISGWLVSVGIAFGQFGSTSESARSSRIGSVRKFLSRARGIRWDGTRCRSLCL
jgi:hypothetical protein